VTYAVGGRDLRLPEVFVRYIKGVMQQERRTWSLGEVERAYARYVDRQNLLVGRLVEARERGEGEAVATITRELLGEVPLADGRWRQMQMRRIAKADRRRKTRRENRRM
jgi:hypothetical protein